MTAQSPSQSPKAIDLSELMARKLEGLAQRVRDGAVIGFDLCWNLNQARQHPTLLVGVMLMQAHQADDFIDCLDFDKPETPEAIQREVNQILETDKIQVEDHMAAENLITNDTLPGAIPEPDVEDDEDDDYHVLDPDEDDGNEGGDDE